MQKYTEHIEEIEGLYKGNLDNISIDTTGMWDAFEKQLPPVMPLPANKVPPITTQAWLKLSVIVNVLLAGWVIYFLTSRDTMEPEVSAEPKEINTRALEVNENSKLPSSNSVSDFSEKKPRIEKKSTSNNTPSPALTDSISGSTERNAEVSKDIPVEKELKSIVEPQIKNVKTDSLASDNIKEYYKGKKGTQKLFK